MASLHYYSWQPLDSIWSIAARYLADAGWADVPTFVQQIQNANFTTTYDWQAVPTGTRIVLPYSV